MLLTSLCAILSCSSGGGGGSGKSYIGNNTPINPPIVNPTPGTPPVTPPVVVNNTRFTTTPDITKLKEGLYFFLEYAQKGDNTSNMGTSTIVNAMKYGFNIETGITVSPSTSLTVKKDGAAFYSKEYRRIGRNEVKDLLNGIHDADNVTLDMRKGSNLLVIRGPIYLSDSDFSDILSEIPGLKSRISGTEYNEVAFENSNLFVDENINLDEDDNKYFKTSLNTKSQNIHLIAGKTLTGTKDGQVAIKTGTFSDNMGTIRLTGKNTVALFSGIRAFNSGLIEVGEGFMAQYVVSDDETLSGGNKGTITLGKNSTGVRADTVVNDIFSKIINKEEGKILSIAEKVTGMMVYTADKAHAIGNTDSFKIKNEREINLSGDRSTGMYMAEKVQQKCIIKVKL